MQAAVRAVDIITSSNTLTDELIRSAAKGGGGGGLLLHGSYGDSGPR